MISKKLVLLGSLSIVTIVFAVTAYSRAVIARKVSQLLHNQESFSQHPTAGSRVAPPADADSQTPFTGNIESVNKVDAAKSYADLRIETQFWDVVVVDYHSIMMGAGEMRLVRERESTWYRVTLKDHELIDLDGNGAIDVSMERDKIRYAWNEANYVKGKPNSKFGVSSMASVEDAGISFVFSNGQWHWWSKQQGTPTSSFAKSIPRLVEGTWSRSVQGPVPRNESEPKKHLRPNSETEIPSWKLEGSWFEKRDRPMMSTNPYKNEESIWLSSLSGKEILTTFSNEGQCIRFQIDDEADVEGWARADHSEQRKVDVDNTGKPLPAWLYANKSMPFHRFRVRLRKHTYEDINGDGIIDGYHVHGTEDAKILVGSKWVNVRSCDWEEGVAHVSLETNATYHFSDAKWSER